MTFSFLGGQTIFRQLRTLMLSAGPATSFLALLLKYLMKIVWRAIIEAGFIILLFYSNLLMGEFERSGLGRSKGLIWAIEDIFTAANFEIAVIAALIGYALVEFLRNSL